MPRPHERRASSLLELLCAIGIFGLLTIMTILSMREVSRVWQKTSARDMAMRELLRVDAVLQRDLVNSSSGPTQSRWSAVQAGSGSVPTSDALAMIVTPPDQTDLALTSDGLAAANRITTYYLGVPANLQASTGLNPTFVADSAGYEDQCPYKCMIRRETTAPAPPLPGQLSEVPANWFTAGVIEAPVLDWREPERRVVARNLLQFRVLQGPPVWDLSITAVSLGDARRALALGSVPLSGTRYAITHRISVVAKN